ITLAVMMVLVFGFSACSSAPDPRKITCDDYAKSDFQQQRDIEIDLLKAHHLDSLSTQNTRGLLNALTNFCGPTLSNYQNGRAAQNGSRPIDEAVDWESKRW